MARSVSVHVLWIPLGAGEASRLVRWTGRAFESACATIEHRAPLDLYHSALVVSVDGVRFGIEMAPAWRSTAAAGEVMRSGAVGLRGLGSSRYFRYEVRCLADGAIPDRQFAVGVVSVDTDPQRARRLLDLPREFPAATWGRDEFDAGEMWNSNSLTSWLLDRSGHDVTAVSVPAGGRAPGWQAGITVARGGQCSRRQKGPSWWPRGGG